MIKTGIVLFIILLEVSYLSYTTSHEYPNLDTAEIKANLRFKKALMAKRKSQIEQKEALKYLEAVLLDIIDCNDTPKDEETVIYTNGAGVFDPYLNEYYDKKQ